MSDSHKTRPELTGALRHLLAGECGQYLNARQVATVLGVCVKTVRRLHADGQLRCFRLGYRTVRYSDTDVALFLRSRMSVIEGGKPEETMQPKTAEYWRAQGYQLSPLQTHCPACQAAVDVWAKPNRHESTARLMVLVDPRTFEPHWAGCPNAKQFRTEQQRQAGRL